MNTNYTTNGSAFYYRVTLQQDSGVQAQLEAPWVATLPRPGESPLVTVLVSETVRASAGMYVLVGTDWRLVLPYTEVAEGVRAGFDISIYFDVDVPIAVDPQATIWRNGLQFTGTQVEPGLGYVWAVTKPPAHATGSVNTVNGVGPDGSGNVSLGISNIPGLQTELDGKIKQVTDFVGNPPGTGSTSLVHDDGTTDGIAKLNRLVPGTGINLSYQTASGLISFELQAPSSTVIGGVKAGTNITIAPDGTISATASQYVLPVSTASILGGVKIGANVSVTADGTISVAAPYSLPIATATVLGGVKIGSGINVTADGTISAQQYALPIATASILGGVKIGAGINVAADGTISSGITQGVTSVTSVGSGISWIADDGSTNSQAKVKSISVGPNMSISLPGDGNTVTIDATVPVKSVSGQTGNVIVQATDANQASGVTLIADPGSNSGNIRLYRVVAGTGITITPDTNNNLVFASSGGYTLPAATASVLGGVKIGANVSVTADGTISVAAPYTLPAATASVLGGVKVGSGLNVTADGTLSVAAAGGVTSVNTKVGAVSITGVGNITVDNSGSGIVLSSSGIADAPNDGNLYGRKNLAWSQIPDVTQALTAVNSAGSVSSTSLVFNPSTNNVAQLKGIIAGTGVTITDDSAGNLTLTASANGFVTSVNGQNPNGTGAVTLTAAQVGALPTSGGMMTGPINMNSQSITNLPTPVGSGDAVPYSLITGMTIDNGTYA